MTVLLSKAVKEAAKLPENLQEQMAGQWLDDIKAELKWDQTLAKSKNQLGSLADKALKSHKTGKTKKTGFDKL